MNKWMNKISFLITNYLHNISRIQEHFLDHHTEVYRHWTLYQSYNRKVLRHLRCTHRIFGNQLDEHALCSVQVDPLLQDPGRQNLRQPLRNEKKIDLFSWIVQEMVIMAIMVRWSLNLNDDYRAPKLYWKSSIEVKIKICNWVGRPPSRSNVSTIKFWANFLHFLW